MSGPGLVQSEAHRAIHQAAFAEAERLTRVLRRTADGGSEGEAAQVADALLEHWEAHTLVHAQAEEEGLYRDIARGRPQWEGAIAGLARDHALMRRLRDEIRGILAARGFSSGVAERFEAMLLINAIHSREEEAFLFSEGGGAAAAARMQGGAGHGK